MTYYFILRTGLCNSVIGVYIYNMSSTVIGYVGPCLCAFTQQQNDEEPSVENPPVQAQDNAGRSKVCSTLDDL